MGHPICDIAEPASVEQALPASEHRVVVNGGHHLEVFRDSVDEIRCRIGVVVRAGIVNDECGTDPSEVLKKHCRILFIDQADCGVEESEPVGAFAQEIQFGVVWSCEHDVVRTRFPLDNLK